MSSVKIKDVFPIYKIHIESNQNISSLEIQYQLCSPFNFNVIVN